MQNFCEHPYDNNRKLYFFADAVHAFKNIKWGLVNNKFFTLPQEIVTKYKLPTDKVVASHLSDLTLFQRNSEFKLAPKLNDENLDPNRHFQKMRVSNSSHVLSHEISAGLVYLSKETSNNSYITTSWFIKQISRWFKLMTSRHSGLVLSNYRPEKYAEAVEFLNNIIELFTQLKVGSISGWKPFQNAVIISTTSLIQLSSYLLNERGFQFVLSSRFTQDCLENLFFVIRMKNVIPNAFQFKNNLKLISVSQYLKNTSNCNYFEDDRQFLGEFFDIMHNHNNTLVQNRPSNIDQFEKEVPHLPESEIKLTKIDLNCLHNIAGYIIRNIEKNQKTCKNCINHTKMHHCLLVITN